MKRAMIIAALATATVMSSPAAAADYLFDFSGPGFFGPLMGSGTFAVGTTPIANQGRTAYAITGISGAFNGSAITGLLPGFLGANNYYYLDDPFVDASGVSFTTAAGQSVNLFNQSSNGLYRVNVAPFNTGFVTATSTAVAGAVPEPATWALLLLGFGALGSVLRASRRKQTATVAYA